MKNKDNKKRRRKNKNKSKVVISTSNSPIYIATDNSSINFPQGKSSKWSNYIGIAAAIVTITGFSLYSIIDLFNSNEDSDKLKGNGESDTITIVDTPKLKQVHNEIQRTSHVETNYECIKDCTVVHIHHKEGKDTIIVQPSIHKANKQKSDTSIAVQ